MQTRSKTRNANTTETTKTEPPKPTPAKDLFGPRHIETPEEMEKALMNLTIASTVRLASGAAMPRLGFGVYQARGEECRDAVTAAVNDGYRHIDSAQGYHNEHREHPLYLTLTADVAAGIRATSVPRSPLFLTTKFMPGHSIPSEDEVYKQLEKSRGKLDPEAKTAPEGGYVDLMLIHAPRPNEPARAVHWAALARAQRDGWVRDIGVSNFGVKHLKALPAPLPAVNQIELHPFCQQKDIVDYCREKGIVVQAYCPLVRAKEEHMKDPVLVEVAKKHVKEVPQVLIRWSLQKGFVPLPKSVTPSRIKANTEVYDFVLDKEDMARIDALDKGSKGSVSWNPVDHD